MAVYITSLNSGSNGNCYYVGNDTEAVLVDAGLSCRETEKRMLHLGLCITRVKAIFISHEHSDHTRGLAGLSARYNLPVFITAPTFQHSHVPLRPQLVQALHPLQPVAIGALTITGFAKHHDAADPLSFIISCNGVTIGVFTDIGAPCERLISHFKQCHAAFLEANYDEAMLENGRYPWFLKNRIRGGKGHLSNRQALEVFTTHRPAFMSHLLLAHLSKDNNCPLLVQQLFEQHARGTMVTVASRFEQTPVYRVVASHSSRAILRDLHLAKTTQLSLF